MKVTIVISDSCYKIYTSKNNFFKVSKSNPLDKVLSHFGLKSDVDDIEIKQEGGD